MIFAFRCRIPASFSSTEKSLSSYSFKFLKSIAFRSLVIITSGVSIITGRRSFLRGNFVRVSYRFLSSLIFITFLFPASSARVTTRTRNLTSHFSLIFHKYMKNINHNVSIIYPGSLTTLTRNTTKCICYVYEA